MSIGRIRESSTERMLLTIDIRVIEMPGNARNGLGLLSRSWLVCCLTVLALTATSFATSLVQYHLFKRTRLSDLIVFGEVIAFSNKSVSVAVDRTLKGEFDAPTIDIPWDQDEAWGWSRRPPKIGATITAYLVQRGSTYEVFAFPLGFYHVSLEEFDDYKEATDQVLLYQSTNSVSTKTRILRRMLQSTNGLSQREAATKVREAIKKDGVRGRDLFPSLMIATESDYKGVAANAANLISITVTRKKFFSVMIDLLESKNGEVADAAYRKLKGYSSVPMAFKSDDPPELRTKAIQSWRDWWAEKQKELKGD